MTKTALSFLFMGIVLPAGTVPLTPEINPLTPLMSFEIPPIKKLSDQITNDSFGLVTRGSLTLKKEIAAGEKIKPMITLAEVTAGLKLYGLFPDQEAIVNSVLWKINDRLTVRFQNHDYVLFLKEVTDRSLKIGWLEDTALFQISLPGPSSDGIIEQPEPVEPETAESMLVLESVENRSTSKLHEKK